MARILVFDSGVGGISIAQAVFQRLPQHQLIFASDNAAYPYGTKSAEDLLPRVISVVEELIASCNADVLIVACNTASTIALPALRKLLSIDVVGVVPAIKPAAELSENNTIGLLATPATIKRQYTLDLISSFADGFDVQMIGSSELVDLAEEKLHTGYVSLELIKKVVMPWLATDSKVSTIVLACTHFPLLRAELNEIFLAHNKNIHWVDSSVGIAKRLAFLLEEKDITEPDVNSSENMAVFTKKEDFSSNFKKHLEQLNIKSLRFI